MRTIGDVEDGARAKKHRADQRDIRQMRSPGEGIIDDRDIARSQRAEAIQHSTGRAHTESEVKRYLQGAGFADVAVHPFVPGVLSRIAGRKPG